VIWSGTIAPMTDIAKQLVMTPQLQLAIRMLATPSSELAPLLAGYALVAFAGDVDPADEDGESWSALATSPFDDDRGDVFVFGNPPKVRANRNAYPRVQVDPSCTDADRERDALWVVRAVRQRARTFERVVAALVEPQPRVATSIDGSDVEPIAVRDLAETVGMHESTITRVASVVTIRNMHGLLAFDGKKKLRLRRAG